MSDLPDPFRWEGPLLAASLEGVEARFTGRAGGVSTGPYASLDLARYAPERADDVRTNMTRVAELIDVPVERWAQSLQVHGTVVRHNALGDDGTPADGQALTRRDGAGVVLTADCLPVVVGNRDGVAVLHAGWRGLADGVLEEGVRALRALGVTGRLEALIGPAAGGCCYEVGSDVREAFAADGILHIDPTRPNAPIDLKAIAARRLHTAGVAAVHDAGLCTMCHLDDATDERRFFSHRADGGTTGRQAGIVWLS